MTSIHRPGEASFSTHNIRRRGEMAPKVEGGAFRFYGRGHRFPGVGGDADRIDPGTERGERAARGARVPESGAQQRAGARHAATGRTFGPSQAAGRGGSRSGHCRSGGDGRGSCLGPGNPPPARRTRTRDLRADHTGAGHIRAGHVRAGHVRAGLTGTSDLGHTFVARARNGIGRAVVVAPVLFESTISRALGSELLVDSSFRGNPGARPRSVRPGGGEVLAGAGRRERVPSRAARRPEPSLRGSGDSASSGVGGDVRSAPITWPIFDGQSSASLNGTAMVRRS